MARIKEYHGEIQHQDELGRIYFGFTWALDCGCTVVVDKRSAFLMSEREPLERLVTQTVNIHDCRVVVQANRSRDARLSQDRYEELRRSTTHDVMRYMGMDVKIDPNLGPMEMRFDTWDPRPGRVAPKVAPEQVVRQAANPLGFAMPEPPEPPKPEPKKEEPVKLDRFQLIEID